MTTLTPAGQRLLDAASELFYTRGINAVGVELIAETAGTTKKTLYDRFGSKDALIALYLTQRAERWQAFVNHHLARRAPEPGTGRILAVIDALEEWMARNRRGCAFVNAHAEITDPDHPGVAAIRAEKQWMRDLYVRLAREAEISSPETVGGQVHLLHEGAIVARTVTGRLDAFDTARAAARELLDRDTTPG